MDEEDEMILSEGYNAYFSDEPEHANPYPNGSMDSELWSDGWSDGQEDHRNSINQDK